MSDDARMLEIIGRHADGGASPEETRELEAALRGSAELRREYLRYLNLDAALCGTAPALRLVKNEASPRGRRLAWFGGLAAAAAIVVAALFFSPKKPVPATHQPLTFATLAAAHNAVWADSNVELALRDGELPASLLRLESGTAEFLFADGATMLMRGPAVVRIPERKRATVESGRIFVRCPTPESRIAVETATTEVVDLGTEFSVEARSDRSTLVAVLSGEVQVGKSERRILKKGEAVEVRGDGILVIKPLEPHDFSELLAASPTASAATADGKNLLRDPGFDTELAVERWSGTEPNLSRVATGGRSGGAARVAAVGRAHWPQCRQQIATGDIGGRLVVGSVWAAPESALHRRQTAILKVVFINDEGRDFAFALRRFLGPESAQGEFEHAQVAAFAPPGTRRVQLQLMLQSGLLESGAVLFDDARLFVADSP
jgi:ferric-dicitrate binding protein FerR (iron transport regulator)